MKHTQIILAFVSVVAGIALIITAMLLPPVGEIDPTVLVAFGEILTFAGSLLGIDYHYRYKQ